MSAAPRLSLVPARDDEPTGVRRRAPKKGAKASRRRTKPSSHFIRGIEAIERALAPDVHVRQAQERARKSGAEKTRSHVAYVEREIRSAAKVRAYSPLEWSQIARSLADCADKRRESLVRAIDAFACEMLNEAMDRGLITPASFVAGCGALAAERRLTDYRQRVEAKGLRVAADLAAAVERLGMSEDVSRFVAAILRIDADVDAWGTAPIADRLVRAVGDLDSDLLRLAAMHGTLIFGTARTLERYVDLGAPDPDTDGKPWKAVLGKDRLKGVEVIVARDAAGGVHQIAKRADVVATIKAAPKAKDPEKFQPEDEAAKKERERAKAERELAAEVDILAAVQAAQAFERRRTKGVDLLPFWRAFGLWLVAKVDDKRAFEAAAIAHCRERGVDAEAAREAMRVDGLEARMRDAQTGEVIEWREALTRMITAAETSLEIGTLLAQLALVDDETDAKGRRLADGIADALEIDTRALRKTAQKALKDGAR